MATECRSIEENNIFFDDWVVAFLDAAGEANIPRRQMEGEQISRRMMSKLTSGLNMHNRSVA